MIREIILTTQNAEGKLHIAPMGIRQEDSFVVLMPFRPSTTLDNVLSTRYAVVNFCDDVRVFAGCLTGRWQWPTLPATRLKGQRLAQALSHWELELEKIEDDLKRPKLYCRQIASYQHRPFMGFNRAQNAVIEASILVSRLNLLPLSEIENGLKHLAIAVEKTAGPMEQEAWQWLLDEVSKKKS